MTVTGMAVALAALAQAAAPQAPASGPGRIAPPFVPVVGAAPEGNPGTDGVMPPTYHSDARHKDLDRSWGRRNPGYSIPCMR